MRSDDNATLIFDQLACPDRYPRSSRYDPAWLLDLDMAVSVGVTELVTVTSARLQEDGWRDWLLWTQAVAEHTGVWAEPQHRQAVIDLLTADAGEFLTFAMVTARKN